MDLIFKGFSHLNLLGDFNINLLQIGNFILSGKGMAPCQGPVYTLIGK